MGRNVRITRLVCEGYVTKINIAVLSLDYWHRAVLLLLMSFEDPSPFVHNEQLPQLPNAEVRLHPILAHILRQYWTLRSLQPSVLQQTAGQLTFHLINP